MAKNNQDDILKLIEGLSPEEQQKLIQAIAGNNAKEERKKVRRKHYKKEERSVDPQEKQEPRPTQKRKKGEYVNEFEDSPLFHANKQDVETDKKLWANRAPTERDRPNNLVTVECKRCGKKDRIDRGLVFKNRNETGQTEEAAYYCNKCCTTGR